MDDSAAGGYAGRPWARTGGGDTTEGHMRKGKAGPARGDGLAGEAWAAGCRDVQAAINWAAGKGVAAGPPFQAAFRRMLAAQDAAPPAAAPVPVAAAESTEAVGGGRGRRRTPARPEPEPAAGGRPRRAAARPAAGANGHADGEPAPGKATGAATGPTPGSPAKFVEDMRDLRRLLTRYGKKGLAGLVNLLGG
jgi:hypothetical protein